MDKKKAFLFILIYLFAALFVGCHEEEENVAFYTKGDYTLAGSSLHFWYNHPYTKIHRDQKMPAETETMTTYTLYTAKNEYEGCQITFLSEINLENVSLSISNFTNENGDTIRAELFLEHYIPLSNKQEYPDPLEPLPETFSLTAEKNQTIYIRLHTEKDTPAGDYQAILKLEQDGETLFEGKISAVVWDFTLSDTPACDTAICIYSKYINKFDDLSSYKEYYDFMLDYKISSYSLPYDILDDRVDAYMSDPRVTSFRVPYSDDDEKIKAYYNKLRTNPAWMEKAYFYPLDEPQTQEAFNKLAESAARLEALFPGKNMLVPFFVDVNLTTGSSFDFMKGKLDIWCSKPNNYEAWGSRYAEVKAEGGELWWYVCWEPGLPYGNLFVNMAGIKHRILFWQMQQYDATGFLYWCANYWNQIDVEKKTPWNDMSTVKDLNSDVYGDGSLLYPGTVIGKPGPVGSLRLEAVRDGLDDFEYIETAKSQMRASALDSLLEQVSTSPSSSIDDDDAFAQIRITLGKKLSKK